MATPGLTPLVEQLKADEALPTGAHAQFRGISARGNDLSADQIYVRFAAKATCRFMSAPTEKSAAALKRLRRYLAGISDWFTRIRCNAQKGSTSTVTPTGRADRARGSQPAVVAS